MPAAEPTSEAGELALTFNEMLDRLQADRREATARVLNAQEAERLRVAQELHDQIGQELTAVLLGLARLRARAPAALEADVLMVQGGVRTTLEEVRRIALELRPEALDDLGLASAVSVLCERFSERLGLAVMAEIDPELPPLTAETELVVYRVAQEALTNVARHSGATSARLTLGHGQGRLTLSVRDRGRGLAAGGPGTGIRGMHERAKLIAASLEVRDAPEGPGCVVRLEVPLERSS
jgi:two-component system sensor histidine kinase UhpB